MEGASELEMNEKLMYGNLLQMAKDVCVEGAELTDEGVLELAREWYIKEFAKIEQLKDEKEIALAQIRLTIKQARIYKEAGDIKEANRLMEEEVYQRADREDLLVAEDGGNTDLSIFLESNVF